MNFYPFHLGDYAAHTKHLSLLEDLAYRRMIDLYYTSEAPLPPEPEQVARLIGMREHLESVKNVLSDFFLKSDEGYRSKRCDREIEAYRAKADRARSANNTRWKSKKSDITSDFTSETVLISESDQIATNNQEPITKNQEPLNPIAARVLYTDSAARDANAMRTHSEGNATHYPEEALTAKPENRAASNSNSQPETINQAGVIAGDLRRRGCRVTGSHPTLLAWVRDGIFLPQLVDALELAKMRKPGEQIGPGYIDAIVRDPKAGKPAAPVDRWWDSDKGIDKKAKELGIRPNGSDTYQTLKEKIFVKIKTPERVGHGG